MSRSNPAANVTNEFHAGTVGSTEPVTADFFPPLTCCFKGSSIRLVTALLQEVIGAVGTGAVFVVVRVCFSTRPFVPFQFRPYEPATVGGACGPDRAFNRPVTTLLQEVIGTVGTAAVVVVVRVCFSTRPFVPFQFRPYEPALVGGACGPDRAFNSRLGTSRWVRRCRPRRLVRRGIALDCRISRQVEPRITRIRCCTGMIVA